MKYANSAVYGSGKIKSIEEAVFLLGAEELNRLAMAIGTVERVAHLKVKVDWQMFWLHSLVTARVTESLASGYRTISGKEYMAGLLHDIGKVFIEHSFPLEFESTLLRAMERKISFFEAENQLHDTNHADIGGELCDHWRLHSEVGRSIRFHHEPLSPLNKDPMDADQEKLLASCIFIANTLANMFKTNIQGMASFKSKDLAQLPEWTFLSKFPRINEIDIDFALELAKAENTIHSIT